MAYAAAVTVKRKFSGGRRVFVVTVSETEAAAASEWNTSASTGPVSGVTFTIPPVGRIVSRRVHITSGTGTQVASALGRATGVTTAANKDAIVVEPSAAYLHDVSEIPYRLDGGVLYGRSQVNSGSDNSITTELVIDAGVV